MWEAEDGFRLRLARLANHTPEERVIHEWTKARHVPELLFKFLTIVGDSSVEKVLKTADAFESYNWPSGGIHSWHHIQVQDSHLELAIERTHFQSCSQD